MELKWDWSIYYAHKSFQAKYIHKTFIERIGISNASDASFKLWTIDQRIGGCLWNVDLKLQDINVCNSHVCREAYSCSVIRGRIDAPIRDFAAFGVKKKSSSPWVIFLELNMHIKSTVQLHRMHNTTSYVWCDHFISSSHLGPSKRREKLWT